MASPTTDPTSERIRLRKAIESDLPIFYEQQLDPEANFRAAFTRKDPADRDAFDAHWTRILKDDRITIQTILLEGQVAGSVACFVDEQFGKPEVTFWLGRDFWGRGIATQALRDFLDSIRERPIYGWAAKDNLVSIRVMEKCGFKVIGEDKGFANARAAEVAEVILELAPDRGRQDF